MGKKKDFFAQFGLDLGSPMNVEQREHIGRQRERVRRGEISVSEAREDWFRRYPRNRR